MKVSHYSGIDTGANTVGIFTHNLNNRAKHTLNKFANDTELVGMDDTLAGYATIQGDLGSLEKWVKRNLMKFHEGKCKVLYPKRSSTRCQYRLWTDWLASGFKEKSLASSSTQNWWDHICSAASSSGLPSTRHDHTGVRPVKGDKDG